MLLPSHSDSTTALSVPSPTPAARRLPFLSSNSSSHLGDSSSSGFPSLRRLQQDVEEHYESISSIPSVECQRMINQPTNYSCVEGLSMAETQFPPLLSTQLSQVHSDNDYFQTNNREGWCFNGVDVPTMECTSTKEHHKE